MSSSKPLSGTDLIDCANANNKEKIEVVAQRCGYGNDIEAFKNELEKACQQAGLNIHSFYDLFKISQTKTVTDSNQEIAPYSETEL